MVPALSDITMLGYIFHVVDKLRDAMVCYEEAINVNPADLSAHEGLMKSYLKLGNWYQALSHTPVHSGKDNSLLTSKLLSYKVRPPCVAMCF